MKKSVQELADFVQGKCAGDSGTLVSGITNLENPLAGHIVFVQDEKNLKKMETSDVACIIVPLKISQSAKPLIQVQNPKLAWAKLLRFFYPSRLPSKTISEKAFIAENAKIGKGVTIDAGAFVGDHAEIGDEAVLHSFSHVGSNVKIGAKTILHPHVSIYENCVIGQSVILHAGTVIGADGFGYVVTERGQEKVPQVGNVVIEDNVEIGASVTIDRATVGSTRIGQGTKIDNLVQIGHNVTIGSHTVISAQTGISGSSKIGNFVTMGGKVGVGDHVEIGDWVMVGAGAGIPTGKKIPSKQIVFGEPARPYQEARRQIAAQLKAAEMYEDLKVLRKKVAALEAKIEKENV